VTSQSEGDRIFASSMVRDMVRARPEFQFESVGTRELKGAATPMELVSLNRLPGSASEYSRMDAAHEARDASASARSLGRIDTAARGIHHMMVPCSRCTRVR
jgi:hypothetical protein